MTSINTVARTFVAAAVVLLLVSSTPSAQQPQAPPKDTLPDGLQVFDSSTRGPSGSVIPGPKFRVVPMKGLTNPYASAFLPDTDIPITERAGQLRPLHPGQLHPR